QVVAVAAVVAEDEVVVSQQQPQRDGDVLLAEAGVGGAVELALREQVEQGLLEAPDQQQQVQVAPVHVGGGRGLVDLARRSGHQTATPLRRSVSRTAPNDRRPRISSCENPTPYCSSSAT